MTRSSQPPGLLALLLHTLRTEVEVPRRVLLGWAGVDEKQYGRWVRSGHRPDRRGREKLTVMYPSVLSYLERVGCSWNDVVDLLPVECRYPALRSSALDGDGNPLLVAADLDADTARGHDRPEYRYARKVICNGVTRLEPTTLPQLPLPLAEVDAVDLVHAVIAAVCVDETVVWPLVRRALDRLRDEPVHRPHIESYRAAVTVVTRDRCAPPPTHRPTPGAPNTFLAMMDPALAVAVVLADQELLPPSDLSEVLGLHPDYVDERVRDARREMLALGWRPA